MKDFYWDVSPSPEYGTIEIRVYAIRRSHRTAGGPRGLRTGASPAICDSSGLARSPTISNRLQRQPLPGCRYGLEAELIDPSRRGARRSTRSVANLSGVAAQPRSGLPARVQGLLMGARDSGIRRAAPRARLKETGVVRRRGSLAVRAVDASAEVTMSPLSCRDRVIESRAEGEG